MHWRAVWDCFQHTDLCESNEVCLAICALATISDQQQQQQIIVRAREVKKYENDENQDNDASKAGFIGGNEICIGARINEMFSVARLLNTC